MSEFEDQIIDLLPRLRRFAAALTGTRADGDDLVQNAILRALERRASYDSRYKLSSWMFKITQNLWIDEKRKVANRTTHVDIEEQTLLESEDGRVTVERRQMTERVMRSMANLPEDQRLVVAYVLIEGHSYKDASELLNIPIGTVMSRLARARKSLEHDVLGTGGTA